MIKYLKHSLVAATVSLTMLSQMAVAAEEQFFPLIDYRFLPNGDVEARLTVGEFLSREDSAAVMPFVNSGITYHWDGKRFKIKK